MNLNKITAALTVVAALLAPSLAAAIYDNNDNVFDERDNTVVDSRGNCVLTKWTSGNSKCVGGNKMAAPQLSLAQRTIYFGFNSAQLTPESMKKLQFIAHVAKNSSAVAGASIVGYADPIGNASYNQQLSARRAKAAQTYLNQLGFNTTQVATVAAKGESAPVAKGCGSTASKQNIACLQADRRVEVHLQYKQ